MKVLVANQEQTLCEVSKLDNVWIESKTSNTRMKVTHLRLLSIAHEWTSGTCPMMSGQCAVVWKRVRTHTHTHTIQMTIDEMFNNLLNLICGFAVYVYRWTQVNFLIKQLFLYSNLNKSFVKIDCQS